MNLRLTILSVLVVTGAIVLAIVDKSSDQYWLLTTSVISGTIGAAIPNRGV